MAVNYPDWTFSPSSYHVMIKEVINEAAESINLFKARFILMLLLGVNIGFGTCFVFSQRYCNTNHVKFNCTDQLH